MRENRVATVETSNLSEFASLKSQIDTIGEQFATFVQHVSAQAVTPMSVIPQTIVNVTNSPVKPVLWQQNSKPNTGFRPKACFNCGDPSHIKPQCPLLQSTGSNTYQ